VIEVRVEVATFRDIMTERRVIMIASQQVIGVAGKTGLMGSSLGEFWGPHTLVGLLGLMNGHVRGPDAVIDLTLTEVPFLEVVTAIFLMSGMDLGKENHLLGEFALRETLVHEEIVLLMHSTMASLAGAREDLESTTECSGIEGLPVDICGPVGVTVVHTNRVDLFFVALDTVRRANVVTEDPGLRSRAGTRK